jgi:hypothetical protein
MDPLVTAELARQEQKIDAIYQSVEKTRKYLLIIMWSSLAMVVLPIVLAVVVLPLLISTLTTSLGI